MRSSKTLTQRSAASSILMAHCPMARTALRTKSTSTSAAYLCFRSADFWDRGSPTTHSRSSLRSMSTVFSVTSLTMMSSFSPLTYGGSLYLMKKTRISLRKMSGRFSRMRLMLRRATHWISGGDETNVTAVTPE